MKVQGTDGRIYNWDLSGHAPLASDEASSFHLRARALLTELFPMERRLEELTLPGSGGLRVDFFLPNRGLAIEVHGQQHFERVPHFQATPLDFARACARDHKKTDWFELNGLTLIELPYWETNDEWRQRILGG